MDAVAGVIIFIVGCFAGAFGMNIYVHRTGGRSVRQRQRGGKGDGPRIQAGGNVATEHDA